MRDCTCSSGSNSPGVFTGFCTNRWLRPPPKTIRLNRWGIWCLLLSWLPVIGDPLTLVAGVLRTAFVPFVLLVLVGKAARYLFVLLIVT
jgi:membrane protein YqaA with SNARE-associated domain